MFKEHFVEATPQNLNLVPLVMRTPTVELAATKLADRNNKRRAPDFLGEGEECRLIEFLGAVDCKAIRRATEHATQHGYGRRIRREVSVKMVDAAPFEPLDKNASLREVSEVSQHSSV